VHKKTGVIFTRDVNIRMRDGVNLVANIFRRGSSGHVRVMSVRRTARTQVAAFKAV
jgi:predicted acyl esterase